MELIVSEKEIAAKRVAEILSDKSAKVKKINKINVYEWDGAKCMGLSGHVVGVDFPKKYSDWNKIDPKELIEAEIIKKPIRSDIVKVLEQVSSKVDKVIVATDYDREGELIGKEAYEIVRGVNKETPIERVRFSSITSKEIKDSFSNPEEIDFNLAEAGEARQIIDLVWGAALTRYLSLASKQYGKDFISVGRVQSPTLKLIVDREREIDEFIPEDYWEIFAEVGGIGENSKGFQVKYFFTEEGKESDRVLSAEESDRILRVIKGAGEVKVEEVKQKTRIDQPPTPFNTTQFIRAAGGIGVVAKRAMNIAESLYTAGYITYPRTDNTVYPKSLDCKELLDILSKNSIFKEDATYLVELDKKPTRGKKETTDHPPIHPTIQIPKKESLEPAEWKIYELIVRRFMGTVAEPAEWDHLRVVVEAESELFKASGRRLVKEGYHRVYPYHKNEENYIPKVEEGSKLSMKQAWVEQKETQPPRRYGQARLIETMEKMGIGTKSTRHNTIEKLYQRGYLEENPPQPTNLARGVVEAAEKYAELVVSEKMTAELESNMAEIAKGDSTLEEVTKRSREILAEVFEELKGSEEEIGGHIRNALKADKTIGPCPDCGKDLVVRKSRRRGSFFVGCDNWPECKFTLPLPNKGEPTVVKNICEKHDLKNIKMIAGRGTFVYGCPICEADVAEAEEDLVIGSCPECNSQEGGELAIKRMRSGSRLVGCTRYPECGYTLPFPREGEIEISDRVCEDHRLPELVIHKGKDPWEIGCPICNFEAYKAAREARKKKKSKQK
ncbi:DNA topoisomerase I [Candidatus Hikarchaeum yamanae]|uniref:DNA topoisomerase I n=1 Tax=Candidatus Hikarchaeum yamanae TaxID=2675326 RepID=UPI0039E86B2C|tara:strand:+ start:97279 stop:99627 length:2349 start_codon:yes stop_codon:yes gene_type:complete